MRAAASLFVLLAALMAAAPTEARIVQARNSHVLLDLPEGFEPQERFAGFVSREAGATLMVLDLPPSAYDEFAHGFDKDLGNSGYSDIRREKLPGRDDEHLFFYARQHTPVGQFDKYMLILRDAERAAYVTITVNPVEKVETPLSYIEATNILGAIRLARQTIEAPPPYALGYLGPFRLRGTIIGATGLYVLAEDADPSAPDTAAGRPMFVVTPSLSRQKVDDLEKVSSDLMFRFQRYRDMKLEANEEVTIAGMKGYGLAGSAVHKTSGQPVGVYQLVLAQPGGGYYRLVGVAPKAGFERFREEFRRMAASFRLTSAR